MKCFQNIALIQTLGLFYLADFTIGFYNYKEKLILFLKNTLL